MLGLDYSRAPTLPSRTARAACHRAFFEWERG